MGSRILLLAALAVLIAACQRDESRPAPAPSAPPKAAAALAQTPAAVASSASAAAAPKAEPSNDAAADNDDGDDDIDKPWGTDFEIDADANRYFGYPPMVVMFGAKPLNGKPPFTYTWDFGDDSAHVTGEIVNHMYDKIGRYTAYVEGKDGTGETYRVSFIIAVVSPEDFATRKGLDVSTLPSPSPVPTTTP
ncbi:MAG TPA: PKD domain-containing protein [Candidatus Binatia bacterium]|jgi:PKD repeat protein